MNGDQQLYKRKQLSNKTLYLQALQRFDNENIKVRFIMMNLIKRIVQKYEWQSICLKSCMFNAQLL